MGLTNVCCEDSARLCQIHCVNVNSLYDLLLPFVKKTKTNHTPVSMFVFILLSFALGAMIYCNVQSIF